ncbi:MAG: FAD-binding oxidoreductase [Deltaproteobacteria bacterium]|nr:FAD-binding oxidoreductase [Deltaproteobacteria bacterium]
MPLSKDVYRVFEDIVGEKNISDADVILDAYTFNWLVEFHPGCAPGKYLQNRPLAVILPGSAGEVQAIVRACNRYGVKYKPSSTAYGSHAFSLQEDVLHIDLKRMNRIIDIDAKNGFAVVEPYVPWCQLNAEAMKVGLFGTAHQAGSQASALANVTSGWGMNTMGNHGGHNAKNALGVEWVLPDGEMIRLGPPDAWFTGDGPGPSLRGVMRGHVGALGGNGVYTKCAVKLHHWPGPSTIKTAPGGVFSGYKLAEPLERARVYMVDTPDYETLADLMYALGDAEVCYAIMRVGGPEHAFAILAGAISNQTLVDWHEAGMVEAAANEWNHPLIALLYAESDREFAYQEKVFHQVVEECGASIPVAVQVSPFKDLLEEEFAIFLIGNDTHWAHHGGGFLISAGYMGTTDSVIRHMGYPAEKLKMRYVERKGILADGPDSTYHNSFEHNAYIYKELEFHYDAANAYSVEECRRLVAEERDTNREQKDGFECQDIGLCLGDARMTIQERFAELGPLYGDFHIWQERMKRAFDPNDVADRSTYGIGTAARNLKV